MAPELPPPLKELSWPTYSKGSDPPGDGLSRTSTSSARGMGDDFRSVFDAFGRMLNSLGRLHDSEVKSLTLEISYLRQENLGLRKRLCEQGGNHVDIFTKAEFTEKSVWRGDAIPERQKRNPLVPLTSGADTTAGVPMLDMETIKRFAMKPRPFVPAKIAKVEAEEFPPPAFPDENTSEVDIKLEEDCLSEGPGPQARKSVVSASDIAAGRLRPTVYSSTRGSRFAREHDELASSMFDMGDIHEDDMALREVVVRRLRMRLGAASDRDPITGITVYSAVTSLGLMKYSEVDLDVFMQELNRLYKETMGSPEMMAGKKPSWTSNPMLNPSDALWNRLEGCLCGLFEPRPETEKKPTGGHQARRRIGSRTMLAGLTRTEDADSSGMPFERFVQLMLDDDIRQHATPAMQEQMNTIAEVLLSGESNRVIAELTNTRIDDLASPPPKRDVLTLIEPIVGFMIVANGILIGLQSDVLENWHGWWSIEFIFVIFFVLELGLRVGVTGLRDHFMGPGSSWNIFDFGIICAAVGDLIFSINNNGSTTVLRLFRLTRLSRMLRMLRFRFLRELTLMLKGLMGGFRTLGWAMVLLVSTIYVIALFSYSLLGHEQLAVDIENPAEYFSTVPRCMFTCFRCFTGDCVDVRGFSLIVVLQRAYGAAFVVPYTMCTMLVTFGIFNLITAIYIEATLTAARHQDEVHKSRRKRESLRVAHTTKKLLKKFCEAQRVYANNLGFGRGHDSDIMDLQPQTTKSTALSDCIFLGDELQEDSVITKEVFLLVVQDKAVQALMDDLDITPERAHLFDVLDSDGSGGLHVTELVQGLLKVRGEARKSDVIACLLSVRALQDMMRAHKGDLEDQLRQMRRQLAETNSSFVFDDEARPGRRGVAVVPTRPQ